MPDKVAFAASNDLNSFIGLVIFLTKRWSCSTILLRYLILRTNICMNLGGQVFFLSFKSSRGRVDFMKNEKQI